MKKFFLRKFKFLISLIVAFLFAQAFLYADDDNRTVINIENAHNTRYEKDKGTGNDVIILTGDVRISVTKGSTKNVIRADVIRYDRVTEMIYADGSVELEQTTSSSGTQTVTAYALMFNTSTLEGVFDDGRVVQTQSDAINLPSGSTLIVASDIFGRSESNTIAFKDGVLTFCDDEDPHWNIKASRIWLLPGGEFAFLNALMYVGPVPVFYMPAFYYPKDELIFNPVFGYRKREGYYVQTTAYLFGRKPLQSTTTKSSSEDSDSTEKLKALFNFVKPSSLKEQKIEGLMLHNLDKDYSGDTTNYLKLMGDWYSNLGIMIGLDGVVKPKKYISNIEMNLNLGFSNTVFKDVNGNYLPYYVSGQKYQEESNLLGFKLPFRYSGAFKMSMSKPFSLSLSMPVYSDPFFSDDFSEREETMDWISYLIDSQNKNNEEETINEISSFTWTLSSSYTVPLGSWIKPYVSSLSMTLNSSLVFSTMSATELSNSDVSDRDLSAWKNNTPRRKFYYPSQITPATFSLSLSGSLIDYSRNKTKSAKNKNVSFAVPLEKPEEFLTDQEIKAREEKAKKDSGEEEKSEAQETSESKDEETKFVNGNIFPSVQGVSSSTVTIPGITFAMKYSVKPNLNTQLNYSSTNLKSADDFEWDKLKSSMYTLKVPVTLDNSFTYGGGFFSLSNGFSFNPVWQEHPYINYLTKEENETSSAYSSRVNNDGAYTEDQANNLKKTDYAAQKKDLTNTNTVSLKPFYYVNCIKDTGITWRSSAKIITTKFDQDSVKDKDGKFKDTPEWDYKWVDWGDEDCITTNALDFTFASNQLDNKFTQSFTLTSTLKPQAESYYGTLKFGFPYTSVSFESGYKKTSTASDADWVKQPFKENFSFSYKLLGSNLNFSENYSYNLEDEHNDSLKFTLGWQNLSVAYTMSYTYGYDMEYDEKGNAKDWKIRTEQEFLPYSLSFNYNPATKTVYTWKKRVSMGVGLSTGITADLLKPTSSYFTFQPSISFKIHEFLTFTFSSTSKNSVIYRYFGNDIGLVGETNMFKDLMNSFSFDDEEKRKASGFKLKSLNFTLTHQMHDWNFNTTFKMEPRLISETGKKSYYDFSPYVTISILWNPMSAMKTEIIDKYGDWELQ